MLGKFNPLTKSHYLLNLGRLIQTAAQPFCLRSASGQRRFCGDAVVYAPSTATATANASSAASVANQTAASNMLCDQLIASVRASIVPGSRVSCGVCRVPAAALTLYYGKDRIARRISMQRATPDELELLAGACDPAEDVLDASCHTAGQLDVDAFASKLDVEQAGLLRCISIDLLSEQQRSQTNTITAQLSHMRVYRTGGFSQPPPTIPRGADTFGSLIVVFPTLHTGGASVLRCSGRQWRFDAAQALAAAQQPSIAFMAFRGGVHHQMLPVENGHRVTLTYNLALTPATLPDVVGSQTAVDSETLVRDTLTQLLAESSFLPKGGLLGFGLQYPYPPAYPQCPDYRERENSIGRMMGYLQGRDAMVKRVCEALSLPVRLKLCTQGELRLRRHPGRPREHFPGAVLTERVMQFDVLYDFDDDEELFDLMAEEEGAIVLLPEEIDPYELDEEEEYLLADKLRERVAKIHWITELTQHNVTRTPYAMRDHKRASYEYCSGTMCLVAAVGPAGDRQAVFRSPSSSLDEGPDGSHADADGRTSRDLFAPALSN
ncbi:uncharacterized protein LOC129598148 [Paramacrobiotus metropolitanus]|uniref:uncharacterized protein LOC129598148 n=1 Tax=Paramacrobiotus metropolitanus TaxID=2943436 RepID=UPI00244610C4|nr:uncharacterized protein LOC129598148 [Paramacrobiotus metropolitanus]